MAVVLTASWLMRTRTRRRSRIDEAGALRRVLDVQHRREGGVVERLRRADLGPRDVNAIAFPDVQPTRFTTDSAGRTALPFPTAEAARTDV
jgi:hypothetical protein